MNFTDIVIRHLGYHNPIVRRQKMDRNLRILSKDLEESPTDAFVHFNLGGTYFESLQFAKSLFVN